MGRLLRCFIGQRLFRSLLSLAAGEVISAASPAFCCRLNALNQLFGKGKAELGFALKLE